MTDDDKYFTTKSGKTVNISELLRIYETVNARFKPGMTEAEMDQLIYKTVKEMSPN